MAIQLPAGHVKLNLFSIAHIIFLLKLLSSLLSGLLALQSNQSDPQFAPLCSSHRFSEQGPRKSDLKVAVSPSTSLPHCVNREL